MVILARDGSQNLVAILFLSIDIENIANSHEIDHFLEEEKAITRPNSNITLSLSYFSSGIYFTVR